MKPRERDQFLVQLVVTRDIKMENFDAQFAKYLNLRKIFQQIIMLLVIKKEAIAKFVRLKGIKTIQVIFLKQN